MDRVDSFHKTGRLKTQLPNQSQGSIRQLCAGESPAELVSDIEFAAKLFVFCLHRYDVYTSSPALGIELCDARAVRTHGFYQIAFHGVNGDALGSGNGVEIDRDVIFCRIWEHAHLWRSG